MQVHVTINIINQTQSGSFQLVYNEIEQHAYSRRHKNGDVSVPFRSVETERELCRLPFYHLHTTVAFPFRLAARDRASDR